MTRRRVVTGALAAGAVAIAALLAGCSGPGPDEAPTVTSTPAPSRTADPIPTVSAAADPACDTIITRSLVDTFTAEGWTAKKEPFLAADITLPGGIICTWGDFTVGSDHVQIFGWAPATSAQQDAIRAQLLSQGWQLADDATGAYITESSATAIAKDRDGYGMTYQFGDGWVRFADTKQGLLLIEWPRT